MQLSKNGKIERNRKKTYIVHEIQSYNMNVDGLVFHVATML